MYQRVQERIEKDRMYEYFLKRSDLELVEGQLSSLETARKNEEIRLSQAKAQLEMLQKERSEKQEIATNIRVELRHNQEFVALEEEKKELKRLQDKRQEAMNEGTELKKSVAQAARDCESFVTDYRGREHFQIFCSSFYRNESVCKCRKWNWRRFRFLYP